MGEQDSHGSQKNLETAMQLTLEMKCSLTICRFEGVMCMTVIKQ